MLSSVLFLQFFIVFMIVSSANVLKKKTLPIFFGLSWSNLKF